MDHVVVSRTPLFVRIRIALRNKTCTFEYLLLLVPTMDRINQIKFLLCENPSLWGRNLNTCLFQFLTMDRMSQSVQCLHPLFLPPFLLSTNFSLNQTVRYSQSLITANMMFPWAAGRSLASPPPSPPFFEGTPSSWDWVLGCGCLFFYSLCVCED